MPRRAGVGGVLAAPRQGRDICGRAQGMIGRTRPALCLLCGDPIRGERAVEESTPTTTSPIGPMM
jgi:hypothetical protein